MAVGIYKSGLGQCTNKESVEKYAARYIKELEYGIMGRKEVPINLKYEIAEEKNTTSSAS